MNERPMFKRRIGNAIKLKTGDLFLKDNQNVVINLRKLDIEKKRLERLVKDNVDPVIALKQLEKIAIIVNLLISDARQYAAK